MQRLTYVLKHPIEYDEGEGETRKSIRITELKLAPRIKGRHMRATDMAQGPVQAKLLLISALSGITRMEADELDEEDIIAIDALFGGDVPLGVGADLSTDGLRTGSPSSAT